MGRVRDDAERRFLPLMGPIRIDNAAGIMTVDENLLCSFQILKGATSDYKFPRWGLNMHGSELRLAAVPRTN